MGTPWLWITFNAFVLLMLAVDLGMFHRRAHAISLHEAGAWSVVWVVVSLAFNLGILHWSGKTPALEFFTGYLIEKFEGGSLPGPVQDSQIEGQRNHHPDD